ncbi:hypothetical protein GHT06_009930 [Daphnia sinensis]|uniref:Uncharacterized protein n=1 Tax=Daphnia sinensis TaxID=1820382 RepID=A0AAD5LHN2_9CRUS|nr:hypothetical protein GHT06_009930 [Daphnia sinensis]
MLLDRSDIWSGGEDLFGRKFLRHLVNEAKAQSTLEGISKVNKKPPPTKDRHPGPARDSTSNQQRPRNSYLYTAQRDRYITYSYHSFGGQVSRFIDNWAKITSEPWVFRTVEHGLSLDFISTPTQLKIPRNAVMNDQQLEICDTEIFSLLRKGAITPSDGVGFISGFFVVPKSSGGGGEADCELKRHSGEARRLVSKDGFEGRLPYHCPLPRTKVSVSVQMEREVF